MILKLYWQYGITLFEMLAAPGCVDAGTHRVGPQGPLKGSSSYTVGPGGG